MVSRYLLDTNIIAELSKQEPNAAVLARMDRLARPAAIAATTWEECWFGARRLPPSRRRFELEAFLSDLVPQVLEVLPFDVAAADWLARERARLTLEGRRPAYVDAQIAAVAATQGRVLVTRNTRDFLDFNDLRIEDWFSAEV
ncbi:MAG: type II toxin-antitoxin system VapC family toxin [Myxococcales bacterium]|nr:type II toxin-antitoxin system VapC family toxin [Myxococcales bacterium]